MLYLQIMNISDCSHILHILCHIPIFKCNKTLLFNSLLSNSVQVVINGEGEEKPKNISTKSDF